jgi:hypothetical protein
MEFDKFGNCCVCHRCMLIEAVIDGRVQQRFTPEYSETEYFLSNGSRMRVAICEKCKGDLSVNHEEKIMECVKRGWEEETKGLPHWNEEKRNNYLKKQSSLEIVCNSERVPDDILLGKLEEHKAKKGIKDGVNH